MILTVLLTPCLLTYLLTRVYVSKYCLLTNLLTNLLYRCEAELPERLVGGVRLHRFNLKDEKLLRAPTYPDSDT